ncbi:unnamed protein product, partial [Staurois parvus]
MIPYCPGGAMSCQSAPAQDNSELNVPSYFSNCQLYHACSLLLSPVVCLQSLTISCIMSAVNDH